jgi:hypothetical protein
MRFGAAFILWSSLVCPACQGAALAPPEPGPAAGPEAALTGRVALTASIVGDTQGLRFADRAVISTHLGWSGSVPAPVVRGPDGTILTGDAQRTDLEFGAGRYTYLRAPSGQLCLLKGPFAALSAVDEAACTTFHPLQTLDLYAYPNASSAGTGLVLMTERSTARLWVAASGWDDVAQRGYVVVDYAASDAPSAPVGGG